MRSLKWFGAVLIACAVAAPQTGAAPRSGAGSKARMPQRAAASIDNSGRMDANNLDMIVTNHGSIAYDLITGNAGLIYPKGGTRTSVFASGLWVGAKVNGAIRVAIGEYSQEFTPGPMAGGTFQPDVPEFRNYRIERGGGGYAEYMANAAGPACARCKSSRARRCSTDTTPSSWRRPPEARRRPPCSRRCRC
jgi:hypothetical protein